jgi:hypothetical protein
MDLVGEFKKSITYVFEDQHWLRKTWPLPLITLIPVIGLFGLVLFKGWRFETVKHLKDGKEGLPEFDFKTFVKTGAFLWFVTICYLMVPSIICALLGVGGPIGIIVDIFAIFSSGFEKWLESEPTDWVITIAIYIVWAIISLPIYQAGMVRYAITGQKTTIFNVPANVLACLRDFPHFLKYFIFWFIVSVCLIFIDSVLSLTGIGLLIIPPLSLCLYYSMTAFELAQLARKVEKRKKRKCIKNYV